MTTTQTSQKRAPRKALSTPKKNEAAAPVTSKQQQLTEMLLSDAGATLTAMVEKTGWQKHTVRAALTGLKKKGYALSSDKLDGVRTYRAVAPK
jgi:predicted ArsR family transcriptional regulator